MTRPLQTILVVAVLGLTLLVGSAQAADRHIRRWLSDHPKIDSIQVDFDGSSNISRSEIKSSLYSREWTWMRAIQGDRRSRVQQETLGRDTLEIKYLYLRRGFLGAQISEDFQVVPRDSSALVVITIREGRQFRNGPVRIDGSFDASFSGYFLHLTSDIKRGEPVNPFQLKAISDSMKTVLANRGHPYATIDHSVDTLGDPSACHIVYSVQADSLVHFGEVSITGASNFPASVARRELKIEPGKIYRRRDILESQRRLFESGYYSTFQLRRSDNSIDRLRPDFTLNLRERKARAVTFKIGVGQSEKVDLQFNGSAGFIQRNVLGSRRFGIEADYALSAGSETRLIEHTYQLQFTEPWFVGIRMPLTLTGEIQPRLRDIEQDFSKSSWSVSAEVSRYLSRTIRLQLGTEYQNVDLTGIPAEDVEALKQTEGISARRKLWVAIRRDSRDDLFVPSRGSVTELSAEYFGGFLRGDADFYKIRASWSRYRRVWPGWISATRLQGAWARAFGKTAAVPLDEAIYLGGGNTVRGFAENRLGPAQEDGTPLGNRYNLVCNQEFRWRTIQVLNPLPLIGNIFKEFPLWQSVFIDVGNGFATEEEIGFDFLAVAYGTGVQIMSPAGPIRIDYARAWDPRKEEHVQRWHFTILYAF